MRLKGTFLTWVLTALVITGFSVNTFAADKATDKQSKSKTTAKADSKRAEKAAAKTKIDVNTASEEELEALPGVGKSTAKKIVANRPYSSIRDLKRAGLSDKAIQKIQPMASARRISEPAGAAKPSATEPAPKTTKRSRSTTTTTEPQTTTRSRSETTEAQPTTRSRASSAETATPRTSNVSADAAAAKGMVWVNTDSKIYHKPGDHWYGNTKEGSYMTEQQAIAAGYRESKKTSEK